MGLFTRHTHIVVSPFYFHKATTRHDAEVVALTESFKEYQAQV